MKNLVIAIACLIAIGASIIAFQERRRATIGGFQCTPEVRGALNAYKALSWKWAKVKGDSIQVGPEWNSLPRDAQTDFCQLQSACENGGQVVYVFGPPNPDANKGKGLEDLMPVIASCTANRSFLDITPAEMETIGKIKE